MTPAWVLYTLTLSALIAVLAAAGDRAARTSGLPTRASWCAGLLAICLASTWSSVAPSGDQAALSFAVTGASPAVGRNATVGVPSRTSISAPPATIPVTRLLAGGWLILSALTATFFIAASIRLRRARRAWLPGREDGHDIMISDDVGPAVVGILRPVIVLPAWAMRESDERRRLLVAHERQHLTAGDQRVLAVAYLVVVALPWNIIAWWMIARLRHAIEIDCDARVIRGQPGIREYGELLIDVSRRPARHALGLTGFAESPSNLERRLMALTTHIPRRSKRTAALLAATIGFVVFAGCEIPRPAGPASPPSSSMRSMATGPTEVYAPLPQGAAPAIQRVLERSFPAVSESGTEVGKPVWLIADRNGAVVSSWIGAAYSDAELRRVALQPAYDSMQLVVFHASMKSRRGSPISVVWAIDQIPWDGHGYPNERMAKMILDSLRVLQPSLYSSLPAGQAIYFNLDWQAHKVGKIWAGPVSNDPKAQWDYANSHFSDRAVLALTNMSVTTDDGRQVPVVDLHRLPWSMRYGMP